MLLKHSGMTTVGNINVFIITNHTIAFGKFRLPKVYRKTFSNHTEGPLSDKKVAREDIPPLFLNEKKIDVSSEYFETQDIRVILNTDSINPIPGYAYLSVYNYQD